MSDTVASGKTEAELNELQQIQIRSDIKDVVSTRAGVGFFKWLVSEGKVFESTFTGNSRGHYLEGRKSFALDILDMLADVAPRDMIAEILIEDREITQARREALAKANEEEEEELY